MHKKAQVLLAESESSYARLCGRPARRPFLFYRRQTLVRSPSMPSAKARR